MYLELSTWMKISVILWHKSECSHVVHMTWIPIPKNMDPKIEVWRLVGIALLEVLYPVA